MSDLKNKSRIKQAEIQAIIAYYEGYDLKLMLRICIKNEFYCGAEGIKRVIEKFTPQNK